MHRAFNNGWLNDPPYVLVALLLVTCVSGCIGPFGRPGDELHRLGDEIVVCGRLFHTGTRVVLWIDPGGFDAYRVHRRFGHADQIKPSRPTEGTDTPNRYSPVRGGLPDEMARRVAERGWRLEDLRQVVDQFVIHYDVCGTSRRCFEVLHDVRGLSVHFMLDVDGTIYQTLDLKERARHAGTANDRSMGIEIANMGAYADPKELMKWYAADEDGRVRLILPPAWRPFGTPSDAPCPVFRPARNEVIRGCLNKAELYQYDFTPQQYAALTRLCATVSHVFPRLPLEAPGEVVGPTDIRIRRQQAFVRSDLGPSGELASVPFLWAMNAPGSFDDAFNNRKAWVAECNALPDDALRQWHGLLGHYHVTREKFDPGPAFDWERLLRESRALRGR